MDTPIYDENIILADSLHRHGNNHDDLMELINKGILTSYRFIFL